MSTFHVHINLSSDFQGNLNSLPTFKDSKATDGVAIYNSI